jgi:hypothetical protein
MEGSPGRRAPPIHQRKSAQSADDPCVDGLPKVMGAASRRRAIERGEKQKKSGMAPIGEAILRVF